MIGNPPNIIIASRADLSFNDFLVHVTPFVAVLLVAFLALCRLLFRNTFRISPERVNEVWPCLSGIIERLGEAAVTAIGDNYLLGADLWGQHDCCRRRGERGHHRYRR